MKIYLILIQSISIGLIGTGLAFAQEESVCREHIQAAEIRYNDLASQAQKNASGVRRNLKTHVDEHVRLLNRVKESFTSKDLGALKKSLKQVKADKNNDALAKSLLVKLESPAKEFNRFRCSPTQEIRNTAYQDDLGTELFFNCSPQPHPEKMFFEQCVSSRLAFAAIPQTAGCAKKNEYGQMDFDMSMPKDWYKSLFIAYSKDSIQVLAVTLDAREEPGEWLVVSSIDLLHPESGIRGATVEAALDHQFKTRSSNNSVLLQKKGEWMTLQLDNASYQCSKYLNSGIAPQAVTNSPQKDVRPTELQPNDRPDGSKKSKARLAK